MPEGKTHLKLEGIKQQSVICHDRTAIKNVVNCKYGSWPLSDISVLSVLYGGIMSQGKYFEGVF